MSARRLHEHAPRVRVRTSDIYMTTTTVITAGSQCLLIDPALLPGELEALADELADLGLTVEAAVSTHPHWDHVLWTRSLGDAPRFASPRAIAALAEHRDPLLAEPLSQAGGRWYARWDMALVGQLTPIPPEGRVPWSGPAAVLVTHDGHAPGHSAVHLPELGVVVAGDMLSDVEVPGLDWDQPDAAPAYLHGLMRLAELDGVRLVIPGHGRVSDGAGFRARLEADRRYLDELLAGRPVDDPRLKGWPPMQQQHADNLDGLKRLTRS
ncbi:MAG TPA: MBL fold metallo-hydrolase [Candidatus Limnocylindrales bacterium]|nr:MBL fold metallo-hydrolase [Candidatus Limnocylindrales bacterium]